MEKMLYLIYVYVGTHKVTFIGKWLPRRVTLYILHNGSDDAMLNDKHRDPMAVMM